MKKFITLLSIIYKRFNQKNAILFYINTKEKFKPTICLKAQLIFPGCQLIQNKSISIVDFLL